MIAADVEHFRVLRDLPGWHRHGNAISKTFRFDDFATAMRFVDRVALAAVATTSPWRSPPSRATP
jgi:pterin-4a-carbinolamine dehydratase